MDEDRKTNPDLERINAWRRGEGERPDGLSEADLRGARLRNADLHGARLCNADLREADLRDTDLHDADLHDANLLCADLLDADLRGTSLEGANLYGARGAIVSAGPAGSRRRITYYLLDHDEVQCGCWRGTLAEFAARVEKEHKDNAFWLAEYRAMIAYFRAVRDAAAAERNEKKVEKGGL
jgi:hypothetical protein